MVPEVPIVRQVHDFVGLEKQEGIPPLGPLLLFLRRREPVLQQIQRKVRDVLKGWGGRRQGAFSALQELAPN